MHDRDAERLLSKLDRRSLYDMVWSAPMIKVAPTFCISDVGLAKYCRRHLIPVPPRGYWARLQAGQRVKRSRLPYPNEHPLIIKTRAAFANSAVDTNQVMSSTRGTYLDIRVTRKTWFRSLWIMGRLLKLLESRGHSVEVGDGFRYWTHVRVAGSKFPLTIAERVVPVNECPKEFSRRDAPLAPWPSSRLESRPTGALTITTRKAWAVPPTRGALESLLLDIVADLERSAADEAVARRAQDAALDRIIAGAEPAPASVRGAVVAMEQAVLLLPAEYQRTLAAALEQLKRAASSGSDSPPVQSPRTTMDLPGWVWNRMRSNR